MSGRPTGVMALTNASKRLRAYELYLTGMKKADIARALDVTKAAVGNWAAKDNWDLRMSTLSRRVEEQATLISQTSLAAILADMQIRLRQRVAELEQLCGPTMHPATRLNAIKTWFSVVKELEALAPPKTHDVPATAFVDNFDAPASSGGPDSEETPATDLGPTQP